MHEMAITDNILHIALAEAEKAGAHRITGITLVIGELSSVVDDSVQFYFDFLSKDTIAEGAKLTFKRIPATLRCRACGKTYPKQESDFTCPSCGGDGMLTGDAREFYIESIEVE
ncbi:MAG TPA: hydrogenase maturation nickel metallochaperone HypA [Armatimonadota bacterium]|nr:hydrogenase maturation nickel metallochaperone HypA [Armatimonadota bacterium]